MRPYRRILAAGDDGEHPVPLGFRKRGCIVAAVSHPGASVQDRGELGRREVGRRAARFLIGVAQLLDAFEDLLNLGWIIPPVEILSRYRAHIAAQLAVE